MSGAKQVHEDIGGNTLQEWAELAAPALLARGARLYGQLRLAERHPPITTSSSRTCPGRRSRSTCAGARLVDLYPMGPIFDGAGLNVTVISYLDQVDFGFIVCRELVPDLERLAAAGARRAGRAGEGGCRPVAGTGRVSRSNEAQTSRVPSAGRRGG